MGRWATFFIAAICGIFLSVGSFAATIVGGDVYGPQLRLYSDTIFTDNAYVNSGRIDFMSSANVVNYGIINSDIYVCAGCDFYIRNAGNITGQIYLGDNANIVQVIHNPNDLRPLMVNGSYAVLADGVTNLSLDALYKSCAGTDRIVLHNTTINLDSRSDNHPVIEIQGNLTIILPDGFQTGSRPVLSNIVGNGGLVVGGNVPSPLYAYTTFVRNSDLYINLVRDTDYVKIIGGDLGRALNLLRVILPDDSLLEKLDSAKTMDDLYKILSHSIAVHPYLLSEPIRLLDAIAKNFASPDITAPGIMTTVRPFYLAGGDIEMLGGFGELHLNAGDYLHFGLSLYAANVESYDSVNAFSSFMYGGNINLTYRGDYLFARMMFGMTYADFQVPYIFVGDSLAFDMIDGVSRYGVSDIGVNINIVDGVYFIPYVGVEYEYIRVFSDGRGDIGMRSGVDIVYSAAGVDLNYDYKFGITHNAFGEYMMQVGFSGWSVEDAAGIGARIGMINHDTHTSYLFMISGATEF
ncbi:hypothetical protein HDR61_01180 [bacterium]|nr:hypothetical protein [bacterium]